MVLHLQDFHTDTEMKQIQIHLIILDLISLNKKHWDFLLRYTPNNGDWYVGTIC